MRNDIKAINEAYGELTNNNALDSHMLRVYNAVKDGEWSFEDFKDFVSVVRNEAKIAQEQ